MSEGAIQTVAILLGALGILGMFSKPKADWGMRIKTNREILMNRKEKSLSRRDEA